MNREKKRKTGRRITGFTNWQAVESGTTSLIFANRSPSHFLNLLVGATSPIPLNGICDTGCSFILNVYKKLQRNEA